VYLKYGGSLHHHLSWSEFGHLSDIAYKVVLLHRMTHWSPSTCSSDDDEVVKRREEARLMAELVKPSDSSSDSDEGEKKRKSANMDITPLNMKVMTTVCIILFHFYVKTTSWNFLPSCSILSFEGKKPIRKV